MKQKIIYIVSVIIALFVGVIERLYVLNIFLQKQWFKGMVRRRT